MPQEAIDRTGPFADTDPRSALPAFYRAFNERDLEATDRLWLGSGSSRSRS